jgi:light-regulated signal transduction histidine kinase (bacteriophytochrome)
MDTPEEEVSPALRAAQDEVRELQRELALARQRMEDFTLSVSHDLRAPLRHMRSNCICTP